jgi:L-ascorbate metabolism protein UlaG (beta-lactamase superfamily)
LGTEKQKRKNNWIYEDYMYIVWVFLIFLVIGCTPMGDTKKESEARIKSSPQYRNGAFVNPNGVASNLFSRESWEVAMDYLRTKRIDPLPRIPPPVHQLHPRQWNDQPAERFSFSWLGHSGILLLIETQRILVDPILNERASPFSWIGPKRFHPAPVSPETLPPIDVVLITHDHYDHLEKSTLVAINDKVSRFVVPLGIGMLLAEWGIPREKIIELDWWESHTFGTLTYHATPAVHYSGRWLVDGNSRLWCSWSILGREKRVFVSGDSGYFDAFETIGERLGPFDVTFLKIGAYSDKGTWRAAHMTPEEAGQQHLDLKGQLLVPLHWATFDLGLHPWYEPVERLVTFAGERSIRLVTPEVGQQIDLSGTVETDHWWRTYK